MVTGADGFIGSHLVEALIGQGCNVRAFVFYNSFNSWGWLDHVSKEIQEQIEIFTGDVRDPHGVREAMIGCDIVFHLAALIGIPFSYHSPDAYIDTNVKGTLNILQAGRELGLKKIIHTSTSEVYGTAQFVPITEEHPLNAQSPYAATKVAADQLALSFFRSFETPVAIIRPFNTYGPRQSARAVIPTIITQLAAGKSEIRLGALHPTRDFSFVQDTVQGFIAIAESDRTVGEVINIGSNFEISIGEIARDIASVMAVDIHIESDEQRIRPEKSEVDRLLADTTKAVKLTGWTPVCRGRDGFRKGIRETVEWFSDPCNRAGYKTDIYNV